MRDSFDYYQIFILLNDEIGYEYTCSKDVNPA